MDEMIGESPTMTSAQPGAEELLAGRYRVLRRLGRGATKEVYLVHDERLDREVALALVTEASGNAVARARVEREARVTGRLGDHPNVITVYDSGELDGVPYLVLRAMPGGSLASRVAEGNLPVADAVRTAREIAAALAHAHAHGVVHRDVKPDNIWLAADGTAALGDFGIAHEHGADRLTAAGVMVGTVRYLSPEQIQGGEIGPASDLYALGITLYELLTGHVPFSAADPAAVIAQHLAATPAPPSQDAPAVPPALDELVLALLGKRPEDRPASAAAVAEALGGVPAARARPDARRTVAVLGVRADAQDPEALRATLDRAATTIERHEGVTEHHLGDTLIGLFGALTSRGDDALRAARAALEVADEIPGLRFGIETGEVFVGAANDGAPVATGGVIAAAARLADRAQPGEILLGERVRQAVAAGARIDPESGRLLELAEEEPPLARGAGTPFVGREQELHALHDAFAQARDARELRMVTVVGPPGIGKSRLAAEFTAAVGDDATVLAGRCAASGEAAAYHALAGIVRGLGGDPRTRVAELLAGDEQAAHGILGAIGLSDEPVQPQETSWAMRRLLERVARDRPLVVALEDIHWAPGALLDLLDQVAALSSGSPVLLVCLARPELLEERPAWAAPQPGRSLLMLEALGDEQARELAQRLGADERAQRIARRAEGNPLFVEQLVAVGAAADEEALPPGINGVLEARLDQLEPAERMLLQHAAVQGRTFHTGAVACTLPAQQTRELAGQLVALARKGLIGADHPEIAGEEAFRFNHALLREAAYAGLPKLHRADLHATLADWLDEREAADEVVGHHLELACRLAAELGRSGERERALAMRAADRLESASRGALIRGDAQGASDLLARAIAVVGSPDAAGALPAELGAALFEAGRGTEAIHVLDEAIASRPGAPAAARARIEREFVRLGTETAAHTDDARRVADEALPLLERSGDVRGTCRVWSLRAQAAWIAGRVGEADDAWSQAAACAQSTGDERELFMILGWRATAAALGPTPVADAIRRCEAFREPVSGSPAAVSWMLNSLAMLHAMRGDAELADALVEEVNAILRRLANMGSLVSHIEAFVRMLAGQPERAEQVLRAGLERLDSTDERTLHATTNAMLAQAVYDQGRPAEASALCDAAAADAPPDDIVTQVIWRSVKAKVLAREGRMEAAEVLAREAVALIEPTDLLCHHGDAMLDLAEVLERGSRTDEADKAIRTALALYEKKGNVVAATRARARLAGG